jgi:hypothetical protein
MDKTEQKIVQYLGEARVRSYERLHKNRAGVIDASERELARA